MTDLRRAAQQALRALELSTPKTRGADDDYAEQGWKEHNAAITALRTALAEPVQEPAADGLPLVVAGAIFDFAGYLTTRESVIDVGATANASPVADLVKAWANLRGLPLNDAAVLSWQEWLHTAPSQRKPLTEEEIIDAYAYCKYGSVGEPTAWIYEFWADPGHKGLDWKPQDCANNTPLWTHPPQTKTNQCGETCERARLCPACLSQL